MKKRIRTLKRCSKDDRWFLLLALMVIMLFACHTVMQLRGGKEIIREIPRDEYGQPTQDVSTVVEGEFQGETVSESIHLHIAPKMLSEEEKARRFAACKQAMATIILGENADMEHITSDLSLPDWHEETGVRLSWNSSHPHLIDASGRVYPVQEPGTYITLHALLWLDGTEETWDCHLRHQCTINEENYLRSFHASLTQLQEEIRQDEGSEAIILPDTLDNGMRVRWFIPYDRRYLYGALVLLVLLIFLKRKRTSDRIKAREDRHHEIQMEFPNFLDKLVMLLSSGLILSEALQRIAADYQQHRRVKQPKILYEELTDAIHSMKESNSSFPDELMKLSDRLEIREFARLAVILRDSIESGMALADKLEGESLLMWQDRKNNVQKMGRMADTKLIFPLMMILFILIIIVMTPAVLQM